MAATLSKKRKVETYEEKKKRKEKINKLYEDYDNKIYYFIEPLKKIIIPAVTLYKETFKNDINDIKQITTLASYIRHKFENLYIIAYINASKLTGKVKGYKALYSDYDFNNIYKRLKFLENVLVNDVRLLTLEIDDIQEYVRTRIICNVGITNILNEIYTLYRYAMILDKINNEENMRIINEDIRETIQIHNIGYLPVSNEINDRLDKLFEPLEDGINYWYEYQIFNVILNEDDDILDLTADSCISRKSLNGWLNEKKEQYKNIVDGKNMNLDKKDKYIKLHKKSCKI